MKISIIISYYKVLENLKIILKALNQQSSMDFEVIISEDDFNQETIDFLEDPEEDYGFEIIHLNQKEDDGFRKNEMLNRSIMAATTDWLVFIDGDCIPHRHFVKEYRKNFETGKLLAGRRVMLGEKFSADLMDTFDLRKLSYKSIATSDSTKTKEGIYSPNLQLALKQKGLLGCNWGIKKEHLIEVNGYDEDYVHAGVGEDVDIEWRLESLGYTKKSMKNKAIVYHIYHPRSYGEDKVQANLQMFYKKQKEGNLKCLNGIEKI